jgi:cobalt-zinc-cadmium efflux system outer membrane protein
MKSFLLDIMASGALVGMVAVAGAQESLTWDQVKARFEQANPVLRADEISVEEMKAAELTAFLRPNPQFTASIDGTQIARHAGVWQPLTGTQYQANIGYLHERDRKRELRLESAKDGTQISGSQHDDLKRNLLYSLRSMFIQTLEAKTILKLAKDDLDYYDKIIEISRNRYKDGDLAQIDLDRIELMRVQYEAEIESATVNLRTSKYELMQLLDERVPIDKFDVVGNYDWEDTVLSLDVYHQIALQNRPDLRAALQTIQQSETNHKLAVSNGSTDPTYNAWYMYNPSFNNPNDQQTLGLSVSIPLRVFDRNQGEKKRTQLDIDRSRNTATAAKSQVYADVDSTYEELRGSIGLLRPYKEKYRAQATRVRDTVTFAYEHGGASLMDFLNAQNDYRVVQLAYVQLVGSYLTMASQLNMSIGKDMLP